MINKVIRNIKRTQSMLRVNIALSRAATTSSLRQIDTTKPNSWEFSGFSQNGEDGIIDFLMQQIKKPNRYFIEIGSEAGTENNTSWLAIAKKYNGLMIDGDKKESDYCNMLMSILNVGVESVCMFVTKKNINQLNKFAIHKDPDLFSLDIDGNDYHIAKIIMESGFRPKVFVVEYNSALGPIESLTIEYQDNFNAKEAHETRLYYGVSITGWKIFFKRFGYKFVTVELNGVNALFINPDEFEDEFVCKLEGLDFQENFFQMRKFKVPWEKQFEMIKNMSYVEIK